MLTTLKKSAKKVFLTALLTVLLAAGAITALANTVTYLGTDSDGKQYYQGCGSSSGDYIMVYDPYNKTYTFYDTEC